MARKLIKPSIYSIAGKLSLMTLAVVILTNLITVGFMQYLSWERFNNLPANLQQLLQQKREYGMPWGQNKAYGPFPEPIQTQNHLTFTPQMVPYVSPLNPLQVQTPPTVRVPRGLRLRDDLEKSLLVSTLVGCLIGAALSIFFSRRLARPLEELAHAAASVSQGDLSTRVSVPAAIPRVQDEIYHLSQHFNLMAQTLERQEQERRSMIADIAHELRTPISVMRAKLDAIEDEVIPLNLEAVQRLQAQTSLLSRLVDDLRTLSLADAGKLDLNLQVVDVAALMENVAAAHKTLADQRHISLSTQISEEPLLLSGDPDRLAQVFSNLLENAVRYTPAGGWIEVQVRAKMDTVCIEVKDSGPGISDLALPHIFERFYRADESRTRSTGGTGLGLSIVRALVHLHGGQVKAWNQANSGAVFQVLLRV